MAEREIGQKSSLWRIVFALTFAYLLLLIGSAQAALFICIFLFVVVPLIFRESYTLQRSMLFLNFVRWPRNFNYSAPEKIGLEGVRNFYYDVDQTVRLGAWQILPISLINESKNHQGDDNWYLSQLKDEKPVFVYMHGNSGSRAAAHRVELYKVLRNMDYHVITFDYRSYGDSSPIEASEQGLTTDGVSIYRYIEKYVGNSPIFVWGHSLGTGVSSHVLRIMAREGQETFGLVLESPFNNMQDELRAHPLAQLFKFLPWFESCFVTAVYQNGFHFDSDKHVCKFLAPIAILHAEDDRIVPFYLGERLYNYMVENRKVEAGGQEFHRFAGKQGYGHKFIYKDPSLPDIIRNFVETSINKRQSIVSEMAKPVIYN